MMTPANHLKLTDIHCCLDCNYAGPLVNVGGTSQCPLCASRAVWPVSAWVAPAALMSLPFHKPFQNKPVNAGVCDMLPAFFGGIEHE
jgi:hypothetical protein